ncbi:TPA: acyltransferase, partial [Escherichia coli]|nr:acyltransferase [Escherichia coli]HEF0802286.1 acyltransferase [Escherichia coli]
MSNIKYRKDIDGLRAVAILPVLLFHVGYSGFSGGYVGVDIFFVISGYLITKIL